MAGALLAVLAWGSSRCSPPALPRHILCPDGVRLLSKHRPDVQILRLRLGCTQHSVLFLEIISDLLEKQETLGLLLYTLRFFFVFVFEFLSSGSVSGCLKGVRAWSFHSSPLLLLHPFPCTLFFLSLPLGFCCLRPNPATAMGRGQVEGAMETWHGGHRALCLGGVWPPDSLLNPTPDSPRTSSLCLDHRQSGLCSWGPAVAGTPGD